MRESRYSYGNTAKGTESNERAGVERLEGGSGAKKPQVGGKNTDRYKTTTTTEGGKDIQKLANRAKKKGEGRITRGKRNELVSRNSPTSFRDVGGKMFSKKGGEENLVK